MSGILHSTTRPAAADVFITSTLMSRPPRRADERGERLALQALAARMANNPADVLPHFVDLAMTMTDAIAAGLSLYDEETAPDVFEWRHLRGSLARFEHAQTPRKHSPCGVTLDCNGPTLAAYPERVYEWISDAGIVVPEVLLVPLYIGGAPLGTLWVVSEEDGHFDSGDARMIGELAGFVGIALRMAQNEARLRQALEQQEIVAKEMSHRLKNIFAMADGMIRISARSAQTPADMAQALSGRLHALANAHSLVRRKVSDIGAASSATDLSELIQAIVKAHDPAEGDVASRFSIKGLPIDCGDHASNGIALVIHELATNAAKYGALSQKDGHVAIRWQADGDRLFLSWVETGGPPIDGAPNQTGFGTTLAERTVRGQFRGTVDREWRTQGLVVTMTLALDRVGV
ncbi:Two-component sensor histidine kinase, contains HisKA and HATPase domains [Sphingomonas sp. YR710]|nr:Two-component sensor histidine kinase, contains HisKA and HATPase domains [Sphingomonas sp. YR710]